MNAVTQTSPSSAGPLDAALEKLSTWDPRGLAILQRMSASPWTTGILPLKFVELTCVGLNAACTNLNAGGTRRHIRAAIAAGATRAQILMVLKMAAVMSIHSCSLGAPILLEETKLAGKQTAAKEPVPTPACDQMKTAKLWNTAWDPFFELDPQWTDAFMAAGGDIYGSKLLTPKEVELMSIAFDASFTHMYAPGTRRHIKSSLALGATPEEIMEVLKLCVGQGVQALNLGVPILAEELARAGQEA